MDGTVNFDFMDKFHNKNDPAVSFRKLVYDFLLTLFSRDTMTAKPISDTILLTNLSLSNGSKFKHSNFPLTIKGLMFGTVILDH